MNESSARWAQWFEALRIRERAAYEAAELPQANDTRWRFSDKAELEPPPDIDAASASEPSEEILSLASERANLVRRPLARIVFVDNRLAAFDPLPEEWAKKGAHFMPLSRAVREIPALAAPLLFQSVHTLGADKFLHWHRAGALEGVFLHIPKGVELPGDLAVIHFAHTSHAALRPHTLCQLEENASARLAEIGLSIGDNPAYVGSESETFLGTGAKFDRRSIQFFNTNTRCVRQESAILGAGAAFSALSMLLGASLDRHESAVRLAGEGAQARLFSVGAADRGQCFDQRTFQDHLAPNTTSDLLYKNGVFGGARTVFAGMIDVKPKAQGTQGYQSNRNLLMHPQARAYSLPGLEIGANDVKCSHGATDGPIDSEQLFYLRCRGIPEQQAKAMLLEGFLAEVVDRAGEHSLRDLMLASLAAKLETCAHDGQ